MLPGAVSLLLALMVAGLASAQSAGPSTQAQPNWALQILVLGIAVGALAWLLQRHRKPRMERRSQALQELGRKRKARDESPEAMAKVAGEQREQAQQASWDKKRQILEAKRQDILGSIRIAEERKARGEITDHVLKGIKERKERQLEQVDREMEEIR